MNCFQDALAINGWRFAPRPRESEAASPRS
jgi:hypothetical protein